MYRKRRTPQAPEPLDLDQDTAASLVRRIRASGVVTISAVRKDGTLQPVSIALSPIEVDVYAAVSGAGGLIDLEGLAA